MVLKILYLLLIMINTRHYSTRVRNIIVTFTYISLVPIKFRFIIFSKDDDFDYVINVMMNFLTQASETIFHLKFIRNSELLFVITRLQHNRSYSLMYCYLFSSLISVGKNW